MKKDNIVTEYGTNDKYLVIEGASNTLAAMVMLGEVDVYWLDYSWNGETKVIEKVKNPQTIYGASPAIFGIKI